jgi:hypothetical protein
MSEGTYGSKDNSECASLRVGDLPKAEKVVEINPEANAGAAVVCAARQNSTDGKEGSINVVPSGREHPTRVV